MESGGLDGFLDDATAGLSDDPELQREIRAELRAHYDDRYRALIDAGGNPAACREEALRAMGDVLDVAGEFREANRARMKWRGRARLAARTLLVPGAVATAVLTWDGSALQTLNVLEESTQRDFREVDTSSLGTVFERLLAPERTPQEELLLFGDPDGETPYQRQRAIWEVDPTHRVYFGNLISALQYSPEGSLSARVDENTRPPEGDLDFPERRQLVGDLVETGRRLDPGNARYDVVEAALLVKGAASVDVVNTGEEPWPMSLVVHNPSQFEEGMQIFRRALSMRRYDTYQWDMLLARQQILGPAKRVNDLIERGALTWNQLLPDAQGALLLARVSVLYGDQLLREGRTEEAAAYLDAWESLAGYVAGGHTLIELEVSAHIAGIGEQYAAPAYRRAGHETDALRTERRARAIAAPCSRWEESGGKWGSGRDESDQTQRRFGGFLAGILVPEGGPTLPAEVYDASRRAEFTIVAASLLSAFNAMFLLAMAGCALVSLRWRYGGRLGAVIPILLLPRPRAVARVVGFGVALPILLFLLVTRFVDWSGHAFSLHYGAHKLVAEFMLLGLSVAIAPPILAIRAVRLRCRDLEVPDRPFLARYARLPLAFAAASLVVIWCLPPGTRTEVHLTAAVVAVAAILVTALAAVCGFLQGLAGSSRYGLFYGTCFRSLVPIFAIIVIGLSLGMRPFLLHAEARYLVLDELIDTQLTGMSNAVLHAADQLREETLAAIASLDDAQDAEAAQR